MDQVVFLYVQYKHALGYMLAGVHPVLRYNDVMLNTSSRQALCR